MATGFTESLGTLKCLPIVNVLCEYYTIDCKNIMLEHNNTVYLGDHM